MRKLLLSFLLFPTIVSAKNAVTVEKSVVCAETKFLMAEIIEKYDEKPVWGSELIDSKIALFVNSKSKTWTIVQWNNDIACVIEVGNDYVFKMPIEEAI